MVEFCKSRTWKAAHSGSRLTSIGSRAEANPYRGINAVPRLSSAVSPRLRRVALLFSVVIVITRRHLTLTCLQTLGRNLTAPFAEPVHYHRRYNSGDGDRLARAITERGWHDWVSWTSRPATG